MNKKKQLFWLSFIRLEKEVSSHLSIFTMASSQLLLASSVEQLSLISEACAGFGWLDLIYWDVNQLLIGESLLVPSVVRRRVRNLQSARCQSCTIGGKKTLNICGISQAWYDNHFPWNPPCEYMFLWRCETILQCFPYKRSKNIEKRTLSSDLFCRLWPLLTTLPIDRLRIQDPLYFWLHLAPSLPNALLVTAERMNALFCIRKCVSLHGRLISTPLRPYRLAGSAHLIGLSLPGLCAARRNLAHDQKAPFHKHVRGTAQERSGVGGVRLLVHLSGEHASSEECCSCCFLTEEVETCLWWQ